VNQRASERQKQAKEGGKNVPLSRQIAADCVGAQRKKRSVERGENAARGGKKEEEVAS